MVMPWFYLLGRRTYSYCILGDKKELDMENLKKIAPITELTTEDIFGY